MSDNDWKYINHSGASLKALLKDLEKEGIPPGRIKTIIDTGEKGKQRWRAVVWEYD